MIQQFSPNTDLWKEICNKTFAMTNNTNLQLIQFKIIHRIMGRIIYNRII